MFSIVTLEWIDRKSGEKISCLKLVSGKGWGKKSESMIYERQSADMQRCELLFGFHWGKLDEIQRP